MGYAIRPNTPVFRGLKAGVVYRQQHVFRKFDSHRRKDFPWKLNCAPWLFVVVATRKWQRRISPVITRTISLDKTRLVKEWLP
jgi:hypothetical protein